MKKGTKIITTAIALVLVLSFMVVGILAATSATAGISASISWTATEGVAFTLDAWTWQSAEHYDENSKSFPEISPHKIGQIVVDTATTNQAASGITASLNANFIDITDDGVNNPLELYYIYAIEAIAISDEFPVLKIDAYVPQSTNEIEVKVGKIEDRNIIIGTGIDNIGITDFHTYSNFSTDQIFHLTLLIKLRIKNPDVSISNFNADVSFNIAVGTPILWAPLEL